MQGIRHPKSVKSGQGQGIRGVQPRNCLEIEQSHQAGLHFFFGGATAADNPFFHQACRVLDDFAAKFRRFVQSHTARVPQLEGAIGIATQKDFFDDDLIRLVLFQNQVHGLAQLFHAIRKRRFRVHQDDAVIDVLNAKPIAASTDFQNPETGDARAWIDTKNDHLQMLARLDPECKDELMSKNLTKIIEDYRRLLQKDPNSKAFAPLAEALRENGEFQQAEIVAANGIRRHLTYVGGYVALGRILMEQGRLAEARPILNKAQELDPENLLALQLIGNWHLQSQQPKDALKAFKRILFLNPQSEKARNAVQKLESLSADEYEDDLFQYQTLKSNAPPQKATSKVSTQELDRKLSLIDALIVRNDLEKARMHLEELHGRAPDNKEIAKRFELLEESLPEEEAAPLHPVASREKMVFDKKRRLLENLLRRIKSYQEDAILESPKS